jgi:hypothetical protein
MFAIVLLILSVALGAASLLGLTPDTRDPHYGLGPVMRSRSPRDAVEPTLNVRAARHSD